MEGTKRSSGLTFPEVLSHHGREDMAAASKGMMTGARHWLATLSLHSGNTKGTESGAGL